MHMFICVPISCFWAMLDMLVHNELRLMNLNVFHIKLDYTDGKYHKEIALPSKVTHF